jgi:hypothetical protein
MRFEHPSLRQGLIRAWCPSLGASGLTLIDRSGRNNHGTLTNMEGQDNWPASGSGVGLSLGGTNDRVNTNFIPTITGQISYSIWVYPRVVNSFQGVFSTFTSNTSSLELFVDAGGSRFVVVNFNNNSVSVPATVNSWQHIAVAINGTQVSAYRNGVLAASSSINAVVQSISPFVIGCRSNGTFFFNGIIDDFRLYSRTITAAEASLLASRRGIGLQPLPDRAAGLPRKLFVNDSGTWRNGDAYVNTGSEWRLGIPSVNDAGTWK